ncbi:MAG: SUMF1/EgtB/PvdO family nonheme iron enzyme [Verrucomicrobiota bacterium]
MKKNIKNTKLIVKLSVKGILFLFLLGIGLFTVSCRKSHPISENTPLQNPSEIPEYRPGANIYTPIVHQKFYKGERELLGYHPQFTPNTISFDPQNRPYIRTTDGFVQTLDENGKWVKFDFKPFLKKAFPAWNDDLAVGPFAEERIVFDSAGDAYMHAFLSRSTKPCSVLMRSRDGCRTWETYVLPLPYWCNIEAEMPAIERNEPPCLSLFMNNDLFILLPKKLPDGTLQIPAPIKISDISLVGPAHSGGGGITRTFQGFTFVVFAGKIPHSGEEGTPQYITRYDHATGKVSTPVYLGSNGQEEPDGHNCPSMEIDSKGYLHVLLGSHHDPFKYIHSLKPFDISSWSKPEWSGIQKTKMGEGSYTYVGLCMDKFDTLHVIARWGGDGYKDRLVYFCKKDGQSWEPMKVLVEPYKTRYSVWYHKVSRDRDGRLFVSYYYYGNELTSEQLTAYLEKWPEEKEKFKIPEELKDSPNGIFMNAIKYHDPCLLVSNDGGGSWRLALTEDLRGGITPEKVGSLEKSVNTVGMPFVKIPSGRFIMGSVEGAQDEKPLHAVTISRSFNIGVYPVRVKDFEEFVKATGYKTEFETAPKKSIFAWLKGKYKNDDASIVSWRSPGISQNGDHPVVLITIKDAKAFCDWLSQKEGRHYRLPTEAEWEYACRGGTNTSYSFGNSAKDLPAYAWFKKNSPTGTQPVGMLQPNPFGLYDMHGNVWEYCEDFYGPYSDLPVVDPLLKVDSEFGPIIRGGSWIDDKYGDYASQGFNLRSASRYHVYYPRIMLDWVGFRVVMEE